MCCQRVWEVTFPHGTSLDNEPANETAAACVAATLMVGSEEEVHSAQSPLGERERMLLARQF
jgi:hypothetical protein